MKKSKSSYIFDFDFVFDLFVLQAAAQTTRKTI